ncbi:MAG: hypothetical protein WEA24_10910 [Gemmatimonadota bacterium]
MSKFAKGKSWIEHRLADDLDTDAGPHTVNLVARKGTGVQGFRVTVVFIPHDGAALQEADMDNAASTADVHGVSRELAGDDDRLRELFGRAHPI